MANRSRPFIRDLVSVASVAVVIASARSSLADHYVVPSESMLPTVHAGDRILVAKAAYDVRVPFTHRSMAARHEPARGDVVVLTSPPSNGAPGGDVLLKRVAALPGDVVEVRDGRVWLNGRPAPLLATPTGTWETRVSGTPEKWAIDVSDGGGPDFGPVRVPAGRLMLLGDNRGNSNDSRYFGFVDRSAILGRAVAIAWRHGSPTYLPL